MERIFDDVRVVQFTNVSYMGGPFSLTAGSRGQATSSRTPSATPSAPSRSAGIKTSWYSPDISAVPYPEFQRRLEQSTSTARSSSWTSTSPAGKSPPSSKSAKWSRETCKAIDMLAFGEPMVSDPALGDGDTLVQYIETSAINYRRFGDKACGQLFHLRPRFPGTRRPTSPWISSASIRPSAWNLPRGAFCRRQESPPEHADLRSVPFEALRPERFFRPPRSPKPRRSSTRPSSFRWRPGFPRPSSWSWTSTTASSTGSRPARPSRPGPGSSARLAGLKTIGKPDAPDFGHAKKKTAGPSVTQLLRGGLEHQPLFDQLADARRQRRQPRAVSPCARSSRTRCGISGAGGRSAGSSRAG